MKFLYGQKSMKKSDTELYTVSNWNLHESKKLEFIQWSWHFPLLIGHNGLPVNWGRNHRKHCNGGTHPIATPTFPKSTALSW